MHFSSYIAAVVVLCSAQAAMAAGNAAQKGEKIAREVDVRDSGFGDSRTNMEMILRDQGGRETVRKLEILTLEVAGQNNEGDKTLVQFLTPRDINGTRLLSFSRFDGNDQQWLYLPALRRTKRISSTNKSGPFLGSEFSFEDMLSQEHQRFEHTWLRDEPCGSRQCFVIERRPKYESSGYSRQEVQVDKEFYRPEKIYYYDRKNDLMKTLAFEEYRLYKDRHWRSHRMTMKNVQTGKSTTLRTDGFEIGTGLPETTFDPARLQTMR